jgi:hypothetical protein
MPGLTKITRRDFMKVTGLMTGVLMVQPALKHLTPELKVNFKDLLIRAESGGRLMASQNNGLTWKVLFKFGDHLRITGLEENHSELMCTLELMGHQFTLNSTDGQIWKTV